VAKFISCVRPYKLADRDVEDRKRQSAARLAGSVATSDRGALLDAFMEQYRGPGGDELFLYSLDPPTAAALRVVEAFRSHASRVAVSADVGSDLVAPWRSPTIAIIYFEHPVDTRDIDIVAAHSQDDANVILRFPDDTSVFRYPSQDAIASGDRLPLADETQMLWDLHNLGGDDRLEAADLLRQSLLGERGKADG
jgi:hypothetical protein